MAYTDDERNAMANEAAKLVQAKLPADGEVAFVLVVASRTPDDRSRFTYVTNLPDRDAARLLTRAGMMASRDGVADVLNSPNAMIRRS